MRSYIENYCGTWKSTSGYQLEIKLADAEHVTVTFTSAGEINPMLRPWHDNSPAFEMLGSFDSEGSSTLDVELSNEGAEFYLNLSFEPYDEKYQTLTPSIIQRAEDEKFRKFHRLLGPLDSFNKCVL